MIWHVSMHVKSLILSFCFFCYMSQPDEVLAHIKESAEKMSVLIYIHIIYTHIYFQELIRNGIFGFNHLEWRSTRKEFYENHKV